ncbi:MAG TPA: hypothetical protein PKL31_03930 [Fulvivirga sp.]|nr:hypothetical protein [Fulvivirga sp.]
MLIGEELSEGSSLYSGLWDSIGPLSALVYNTIDYMFGRSQLTYQILAYLLVCFQVYVFNSTLITNKAFSENTYIPGFIYALLCSLCYDMMTLTPFLMGLTFVLLAINKVFNHIEFRAKRDEDILNIGLYLGLATIIYLPFCLLALSTLFVFIFFTGTVGRRYVMMVFGFSLPVLLSGSYFYITDRFDDFLYLFFSPFTVIDRVWYISFRDTLFLFSVPILFLALSLIRILQGARLTNYQNRLTRAMFVWMIFSLLFIVFSDQNSPAVYIILAPVAAFYLSHYFLIFKKKKLLELAFFTFFGLVVFTNIVSVKSPNWVKPYFNDQSYLINKDEYKDLEGLRILVLDDDLRPYYYAKPATPFLNWQVSQEIFNNLDYYDNLTKLYEGMMNDKPEIIIDRHNVMPAVFEKIPALRSMYFLSRDGYYHLNVNN